MRADGALGAAPIGGQEREELAFVFLCGAIRPARFGISVSFGQPETASQAAAAASSLETFCKAATNFSANGWPASRIESRPASAMGWITRQKAPSCSMSSQAIASAPRKARMSAAMVATPASAAFTRGKARSTRPAASSVWARSPRKSRTGARANTPS